MRTRCGSLQMFSPHRAWLMVVWAILLSLWMTQVQGMRDHQIKDLRSVQFAGSLVAVMRTFQQLQC